jgi:hypothetical protein
MKKMTLFVLALSFSAVAADLRFSSDYIRGFGQASLIIRNAKQGESFEGKSVVIVRDRNTCSLNEFGAPAVCTEMASSSFNTVIEKGGARLSTSPSAFSMISYTFKGDPHHQLAVWTQNGSSKSIVKILEMNGTAVKAAYTLSAF